MSELTEFRCVNCGKPAGALYRTYGPSVLKLNKCENCRGIVDKYIEYDKVIVMIDTVLISKEAQRHVIYNTEFKSYWKLFIVLSLLETYGLWRNDSLLNIVINSVCGIQTKATVNSTYLDLPFNASSLPRWWQKQCKGWVYEDKVEENDLFLWEKDFYIQSTSTFAGILMFLLTFRVLMDLIKPFLKDQNEVPLSRMLKAFSMSNVSILLTLPMLAWGTAHTAPATRALHYSLVFAYSCVVAHSTFSVLYEAPVVVTLPVVLYSYIMKYLTVFHVTPLLRSIFT